MDFGKEDIALVLALAVVLFAVYSFNTGSTDDNYSPSSFCQEVVKEAESNLSAKFPTVSCGCESPLAYKNDPSVPEKVRNVTDLKDVVVCEADELPRKLIFPIYTIRSNYTSASALNDTRVLG